MDPEKKLESLPQLNGVELRALWQELFNQPPPVRKGMLLRTLAYRIQEEVHGGLSRAARNRLRKVAQEMNSGIDQTITNAPHAKLGTRLIRQWQGQSHEVTVIDGGYAYRGKRYTSLSEIARLITGTRWSGPRFFGISSTTRHEGKNRNRAT